MPEDIHIRTVAVELLRVGPAHNQLLSPLTQYLGVCDDAEAGIVMLPYEQHTFERRMRAMRHDDKALMDDKLPDLRDLGVEMAKLLGSIPRLPGSLGADPRGKDTLVRLSLTLSASELAGLPFELAKVPIGPNSCTESWLSLQARVPVVITRRTRNVSVHNFKWLHCPRILFIASDPKGTPRIPFEEHRQALIDAATPFLLPRELRAAADAAARHTADVVLPNRRESFGELLTIISNAGFDEVVRECTRNAYTHIHILAHGDQDEALGDRTHGLALAEKDGVISGERLASAFACLVNGQLHRPQVVTLATCDSGNSSDVVNPGASIAHVLHQAGIPLVVASQVPLGIPASVLFVREFYRGLLWGEHPWVLMHRVRSTLHGHLSPADHDWASLVVYEALPTDLTRELEGARFRQCRRAMEVAFQPGPPWPGTDNPIGYVIDRLPVSGKYFGMEALALRADGRLRMAHNGFVHALKLADRIKPEELQDRALNSLYWLEQALLDYTKAVNGFLVSPGQGMNAPFRTLVAQLAILATLGKKFSWGMWHMARHWVDCTLEESAIPDDKVWAQGCLAELWLLRMLGVEPGELDFCRRQAFSAIRDMMRMMKRSADPQALQVGSPQIWMEDRLALYTEWWSDLFFEYLVQEHVGSESERPGFGQGEPASLAGTAQEMLDMLKRTSSACADAMPGSQGKGKAKANANANAKPHAATPAAAAKPPQAAADGAAPADEAAVAAAVPAAEMFGGAARPAASAKTAAAKKATQTAALAATQTATQTAAQAPAQAATQTAAQTAAQTATKPSGAARPAAAGATFSIEMLAADQGDSLWIEWAMPGGPLRRMLVDCGTTRAWGAALKPRIKQVKASQGVHFELFMMSHIDSDHIEGSLPLLREAQALGVSFGEIWFNGRKHLGDKLGAKQAEAFSTVLQQDYAALWNKRFKGGAVLRPDDALPVIELADGMKLTLLSPVQMTLDRLAPFWDAELKAPGTSDKLGRRRLEPSQDINFLADKKFESDPSRPNGSSIAVLAEFQGKSLLLAADVHAPVLEQALDLLLAERKLKKLNIDAFKLSHHGSRNNLSVPVMKKLQSRHYLVSTNGDKHEHPDREAIARVLKYGGVQPTLWFNYPPKDVYHGLWFEPATQARLGYKVEQPPADKPGLVMSLF